MNIRKNYLFIINTLVVVFVICLLSSCNITDSDNESPSEIKGLANTEWRLEFIEEVTEGNVFPDKEGSKWTVPDDQYYSIDFVGDSTAISKTACGNIVTCSGNYKLTAQDTISIELLCNTIPRPPFCERTLEYMTMIKSVRCFQIKEDSLFLYYQDSTNYKKGELLVKFIPDVAVDSLLTETKFRDLNVKVKEYFPHLGIWHLIFNASDKTDQEVLSIFKNDNRIIAAQFNHFVTQRSGNLERKVMLHYSRVK